MAFIPGNDGKNFQEHFMAKYNAAYDQYLRDVEQLKGIGERLISDAKSIVGPRLTDTAKHQKFGTIEAQLDRVYKGYDEASDKLKAEWAKVDGEVDETLEHHVNLIAGICSYANATAGHRYLLAEIADYRKAKGKGHEKRMELFSNVCNVFGHVVDATEKAMKSHRPDNSLIAEFERLQDRDPEAASAHFRQHRDALLEEMERRNASKQNP